MIALPKGKFGSIIAGRISYNLHVRNQGDAYTSHEMPKIENISLSKEKDRVPFRDPAGNQQLTQQGINPDLGLRMPGVIKQ